MRLSCDRTGFPLVELDELGLAVSLLPVTKVQFERFLAEPNGFGNAWYENVLQGNPRVSWRLFTAEERKRLFLTCVLPEEALAFMQWMGHNFDLPTVDEWRAIDNLLMNTPLPMQSREVLARCPLHPAAATIVQRLLRQIEPKPKKWGELALLRGGVIEWIRTGPDFAGLGQPPGTLYKPQEEDPVYPLQDRRVSYWGFRLVCRLHSEKEEDL